MFPMAISLLKVSVPATKSWIYLSLSLSTGKNFFFKKKPHWHTDLKKTICNKFLRTHLCHSQFLEHRPHCRSEEPLKFGASKSCQLVDRRANDKAFFRDAWWKFHCIGLKNPVLPRPPVEKCVHCLILYYTSQFTRFSLGGGVPEVA